MSGAAASVSLGSAGLSRVQARPGTRARDETSRSVTFSCLFAEPGEGRRGVRLRRNLAGLAPDIAMTPIPSSDATYGYTSRLLAALNWPTTVVPVHWDNFEVPFVNPPADDRVVKPHLDDFIATVPRISPRTKIITPGIGLRIHFPSQGSAPPYRRSGSGPPGETRRRRRRHRPYRAGSGRGRFRGAGGTQRLPRRFALTRLAGLGRHPAHLAWPRTAALDPAALGLFPDSRVPGENHQSR
jgi:hypothetical protein